MPIDGGMRDKLEAGMVLTARYKGAAHTATVVTDEEGKIRFRLEDGREFKSASAAGSAVIGGVACNGWRFWNVQGDTPETDAKATPVKARKARTPKAVEAPTEAREESPEEAAPE